MAIVVTGGAGFVGSNLVHALNHRGYVDIVVVDDDVGPIQMENLAAARFEEFVHKDEFRRRMLRDANVLDDVQAVLHQGACSRTDECDVAFLLDNNVRYSRELLDACVRRSIPLIYASSAAVYGTSKSMVEHQRCELPLNPYAQSKLLFDERVRRLLPSITSQVVGLRYFNAYGPREGHKGSMASIVYQADKRIAGGRTVDLFGASHGYGPGEHKRDFVHVDDVVSVVLWFLDHPDVSGIYNCGTGLAASFNQVVDAVISARGDGRTEYVPMPPRLISCYQPWTCADLTQLRSVGCDHRFRPIEVGVSETLRHVASRVAS